MPGKRIIPILPDGSHQYKVRASSWGELFDCAYKWEAKHLLGMNKPGGMKALLGTAIHASTAVYDKGRLPGASPVAVEDAAFALVDALRSPDREVDFDQDDMTLAEAEVIGLKLHQLYCNELSPLFEFTSVEQTLQPLHIDCGGGIVVTLTGQMDRARVARAERGVVIPDVKTGSAAVQKGQAVIQGRSPQIGTYQLMYEADCGEATVGGQVLGLKTSGKPEAAASAIFDAKRVMVGTDDAPGLIELAAQMFRSGLFPPNPNSLLCSPKFCARWSTCIYHE